MHNSPPREENAGLLTHRESLSRQAAVGDGRDKFLAAWQWPTGDAGFGTEIADEPMKGFVPQCFANHRWRLQQTAVPTNRVRSHQLPCAEAGVAPAAAAVPAYFTSSMSILFSPFTTEIPACFGLRPS